MILVIDNYDSFTYNLVQYLGMLNKEVVVKRNDEISLAQITALNPEGILISPGPGNPQGAGISLDVIRHFAGRLPVLGVCLGHQSIAHAFGAQIKEGSEPVHGKVFSITHNNLGVFSGLKSPLNVTRYHSLVVDECSLAPDFMVTARSDDGVIMGIRHKRYALEGIQFHPEALLTEGGLQMLSNFFKGEAA